MENYPNTNNEQEQKPTETEAPVAEVQNEVAEPTTAEDAKLVEDMTDAEVDTEFNKIVEPVKNEFPTPTTNVEVDEKGDVTSTTEAGSATVTEKMNDQGITRTVSTPDQRMTMKAPYTEEPKPTEEAPIHEDNE